MTRQKVKSKKPIAKEKEHNLSLRDGVPSPAIVRSIATKQSQDWLGKDSVISKREIPRFARNDIMRVFSNEKGITLMIVLILSIIALAIISSLIFIIITGTRLSGLQKRYKTSLEAGMGGADVAYQVITARGDPNIPGLSNFNIPAENVGGIDCLNSKLNNPTSAWSASCDNTLTINPNNVNTYDVIFELGAGPVWDIYTKIADTVEGNSSADLGLVKTGVISTGTGEVPVMSMPYLYTLEVYSENQNNPSERAQLSVLYQY